MFGGGGGSMFQEIGVCMGFFLEEGGVIWVQFLGEKAVEQPGGAGSDALVPSS